jgi:hypothetical protein
VISKSAVLNERQDTVSKTSPHLNQRKISREISGKEPEPRQGKRRREVQEEKPGDGDVPILPSGLAELILGTSQPTILVAEAASPQDEEQPQEGNPQDKEQPQEGKEIDADEDAGNAKATKAEDAEVKIVKWNVRLAYGLGIKNTTKIARAAEVLRLFCLRWYKRRLTQSYFWWLHQSEKFKQCGIGMSKVAELEQMFNPQDVDAAEVRSFQDRYCWAELGRAVYWDWWEQRVTSQAKELKSGRDVIRRTCNSTWWDWADGLRPAH